MFLNTDDIGSVIYGYQVDEITEGDENIMLQALAAAEEEIRSYLTPNPNNMDGRLLYDVDAILAATGTDRNALILQFGCTIAKWYIIELSNFDILYNQAKDRYDRAVSWFKSMSEGSTRISTLPTVPPGGGEDSNVGPFEAGSRPKFNHEY